MFEVISDQIKEKAPIILAKIKKANSILLHCHPSPDPDSVGSALAMKFALEQLGKKVTLIRGDSETPVAFMHFPGAGDIVKKSFSEIDVSLFDLFIILDSGSKEMISQNNPPIFPLSLNTIIIDHHASNLSYADTNLVDLTSPATSFVLFKLFKLWNIEIDSDIATNLFMGIYTDTGGFKYPPTDYRIFLAVAELAKVSTDFTETIFIMENSEVKESIYFEALALGSIQTFLNDNIAIAAVSYNELKMKSIPPSSIHGFDISNKLKSVIGWNIGVSMVEKEPNIVKLSMRTRDANKFNDSKLAVALGGGGHRAASGALLRMSIDDARKLVVSKAKEMYNL